MTFKRMNDTRLRKDQILSAAIELSKKRPYNLITRDEIAAKAGCSTGTISHHFSTMTQLRRDLMRRAVRDGVLHVIAQGLAAGDSHAKKADEGMKQKALSALR